MATGTVKWFNAEKGYGFIRPDDGTAVLFAHYSGIAGSGYRSLDEDRKVQFVARQGAKVCKQTTSNRSHARRGGKTGPPGWA